MTSEYLCLDPLGVGVYYLGFMRVEASLSFMRVRAPLEQSLDLWSVSPACCWAQGQMNKVQGSPFAVNSPGQLL